MKKLTFSEVRRLQADLKRLERLSSLAGHPASRFPPQWVDDIEEKIIQIKTLLSLHYGKD